MAVPGKVGWSESILHSPQYPKLSILSLNVWVGKLTSYKSSKSGLFSLSTSEILNMLIAMFKLTNFVSVIMEVEIKYQGGQPCHFRSQLWRVEIHHLLPLHHHCHPHVAGDGLEVPRQLRHQ